MSSLLGGGGGGSSGGRTRLTTTTNFYVETTGNDANDGSLASPWLTLQHAMNVISSDYDINAQIIWVNIGTGTFAGFGVRATVGGGYIQWRGNGSANTIIQGGTGADISVNEGESISCYFNTDTIFIVNRVTLLSQSGPRPTGATMLLDLYLGGTFLVGGSVDQTDPADMVYDMTQNSFSGVFNSPIFVSGNNATCSFVGGDLGGTHTFKTGGGTFANAIYYEDGASGRGDGGHAGATSIVVDGSPTFTQGFLVLAGGSVDMFMPRTGTMTGAPFTTNEFGAFSDGGYSGWFVAAVGSTLPAAGFSQTLNAITPTSGFYTGNAANLIRGIDSPAHFTQVWLGYGTADTVEIYDVINNKDLFAAWDSGLKVSAGGMYGWTDNASFAYTGTFDTALSRDAAATAALGNGTQGDYSGTLKLTAINSGASNLSVTGNTSTASVNLILGAVSGFPSADFNYPAGGLFRAGEVSVFGGADIFFQAIPTGGSYTVLEDFGGGGLQLGTGATANPVFINVNRTEVARFVAPGTLKLVPTTIASLPASPVLGMTAVVSDGDPGLAWGATAVNSGAGATNYFVWYNGSAWKVMGK